MTAESTRISRDPSMWLPVRAVYRPMNRFRMKAGVAFTAFALGLLGFAGTATGELTSNEQTCVTDFSRGVAGVGKAQGAIIRNCLKRFSKGSLVAELPETCMLNGRPDALARAIDKTNEAASGICSTASPGFGISPPAAAIATSVGNAVGLVRRTIGPDLNSALVPRVEDAKCQSGVAAVVQKCTDARMAEYVKCARKGMAAGLITDAATLQVVCLGVGDQTQPDPKDKIAKKCEIPIAKAIDKLCSGIDLSQAFTACHATDAQGLGACLSRVSACTLCQVIDSVSGLSRDCDGFDDGDSTNGTCGDECADGIVQTGEQCDDGNTTDGDGCDRYCGVEVQWGCSGQPSVCTRNCGNGTVSSVDGEECDDGNLVDGDGCSSSCRAETCPNRLLNPGETCDDGNRNDGDGCSTTCVSEPGYQCNGQPSVCTVVCGNGTFQSGETCDDGNRLDGDGCTGLCKVENGYMCTGAPSVCLARCGDGLVRIGEGCDDGNLVNGDGCANWCQPEPGYQCTGEPSVCVPPCGDGMVRSPETCDDDNTASGDGCSESCRVESSWSCTGQPSTCAPLCGNGRLNSGEQCDDGNSVSGDGCSQCTTDVSYVCAGQPSQCSPTCGNRNIDTNLGEQCDDGNFESGDGCSAGCSIEAGYACSGVPSTCTVHCGNGQIESSFAEECDDGNYASGDGCNTGCEVELGYVCSGMPSQCEVACGNGELDSGLGEICDDANISNDDGCSDACLTEPGWYCSGTPSACQQFSIVIDSPAYGTFTEADTITITGHYTVLPFPQASVLINGSAPNLSFNPETRTFEHVVTLDRAAIFNPVLATITNTETGINAHSRMVVIAGDSVTDGSFSPESVGLRLNETGLASVAPLMATLASSGLDLGALLPPGTVITEGCFVDSALGCLGSASVKVASPAPSFSEVGLATDTRPDLVHGDISVKGLRVDITINGSGLVPTCGLRLTASQMVLGGNYTLEPADADPSHIDVNLVGSMGVTFDGFVKTFTSGTCTWPIIGDIINALLPDVEAMTRDGIRGYLEDPDGSGPLKSPVAQGIEDGLEGVNISGAVGEGVGLILESPLFKVAEDDTGVTLGSDSRFTVSIGTGPGQCMPPPGAPDLTASYSKYEAFPAFGALTPVSHRPYGLGIAISTAGFNQLLRGQTECGLMRSSLDAIDIDGAGGEDAQPITSDLLSLFVPEFALLPPGTPLSIVLAPTLAPIVTGNLGPNGEVAELKIAQLAVDIVEPSTGKVWLGGAFDARLGMALSFAPDGSGLAITINRPAIADVAVTVIDNPLGANEESVQTVLPNIMAPMIPSLAGALSGFPLPQFFGLHIQGVEVSRNGQFLSLFANLVE